ncbi:DUF421 domain-containing protein [Lysinibacillus sp. BW-2-10]|uniref:YetF domain-containing protein n=1 Tax=Lysinibacillus sp. BW-2-10 TaxID=2590030 RepID=UPI0011815254|nr:DUF421 domain-containing protein [Lysinibacillus sp. BW-2-10]TSI08659.1 DUF421 domain-containing protein [Lysinibacillus sp. BW-2-10]
MPELLLIALRSAIAFLFLLVLTRIMGKKQLSHLTFFDYVVGITVGSIAATISIDKNIQLVDGLAALLVWGIAPIILSYLGLKSRKLIKLTDGKPSILIRNGKIFEDIMKENKITIDELMMLLREEGIFKLEDVEMAILETNGELSVMKKSDVEPITPRMLGLKVMFEHAPSLLIMDGHVLTRNLEIAGYTENWLQEELKKFGAMSVHDVFLAQIDAQGKLYVDLYSDKNKKGM